MPESNRIDAGVGRSTILRMAEKKEQHGGGESNVEYNRRYLGCDVAVRYGYFIYHGWSDPYSARNCHRSISG